MINDISIDEKIETKRGKIIITQSRNYIFYYEYTKKLDNSQVYKCSFYRDKTNPCKAYVILNHDQNNFNLEHSVLDVKTDQIKALYKNKAINNIINNNQDLFLLNSTKIKNIISSKIDISETKKDNLKHNK